MLHKFKTSFCLREYVTHQKYRLYRQLINNVDKVMLTSRLDPCSFHFLEESSVIKTTYNRSYDSSVRGIQGIEIQKYALNATYTVNLFHSIFGVTTTFLELISFFSYAMDCQSDNGLPVFMEWMKWMTLSSSSSELLPNSAMTSSSEPSPVLSDSSSYTSLYLLKDWTWILCCPLFDWHTLQVMCFTLSAGD